MRQLLAILGVAILAGCATNTPELNSQPQADPAENDKPARVSRELSLAWDDMGRGGAALRQPGYIHVLGDGNVGSTVNKLENSSTATTQIPDGVKKGDMNKALNRGKGYSLYELSRWERYCNSGKEMDERDWRFIESEGAANVPKEVVTNCVLPTHTYQDYLNAWSHFCTSQAVTDADRRIVRESVRPYSVVNPCKATK